LNNAILGNNITNSTFGIRLDYYSRYNGVSGNNITVNSGALRLDQFHATTKYMETT